MTAVRLWNSGVYTYMGGCAYFYRVHVVLQYATDVMNLIIKLRQIWGKDKNATSLH